MNFTYKVRNGVQSRGAGPLSQDAWIPVPMMRERRHVAERRHRAAA